MSSSFLITLACHVLLVGAGLGFIQAACRRHRINLLLYAPCAWGVGVILVYVLGKALLKAGFFPLHWHLIIVGFCVLAVVAGAVVYRYADTPARREMPSLPHWLVAVNWVIGLLILYRIAVVAHIAVLNPVMDSDATIINSYTSLSKHLILGEDLDTLLSVHKNWVVSLNVPILNAWVGMFWDRWHDSLAAFSWIFFYFFTMGTAAAICFKLTRHLTVALFCAYLFSELPLAIHHVVRPGFHDLPVAYFFMVGVGAVLLAFFRSEEKSEMGPAVLLTVVAVIGLGATKLEGIVWAMWLLVVWGAYYLIEVKGVSWKKIMYGQLAAIAVIYILYYLSADFVSSNFELSSRLSRIFVINYDPQAIEVFLHIMFVEGSFSIWWWVVASLGIVLAVRKTEPRVTVISIYVLILLLAVFYFSNFTGDVEYTKKGLNPPRFLLQIHALMLPVYYCLAREYLTLPGKRR